MHKLFHQGMVSFLKKKKTYSLFTSSQASYLPARPAMVDQCFVFFTRSWTTVVGFAAWEVGCLRADFNASGRVRLVPSCLFIDIAHGHIHVQQSPNDGCCWTQVDDCGLWWQLFSLREFWGVCVWHLHAPCVSENSLMSDSYTGSDSFVHNLDQFVLVQKLN